MGDVYIFTFLGFFCQPIPSDDGFLFHPVRFYVRVLGSCWAGVLVRAAGGRAGRLLHVVVALTVESGGFAS
jgi:hypothetical protein